MIDSFKFSILTFSSHFFIFHYFPQRENADLTRIRDAEREAAADKWTALIAAAALKGAILPS